MPSPERPRALIAALLIACQGCSLVLVSGPPDPLPAPEQEISCTRRPLLPVVELYASLAAVAVGAVLLLGAALPATRSDDLGLQLAIAGGVVGAGVALRFSSVVGFQRVTRCNQAVRRHERWTEGGP